MCILFLLTCAPSSLDGAREGSRRFTRVAWRGTLGENHPKTYRGTEGSRRSFGGGEITDQQSRDSEFDGTRFSILPQTLWSYLVEISLFGIFLKGFTLRLVPRRSISLSDFSLPERVSYLFRCL